MGTYRKIYYHIIFGTKNREAVIPPAFERKLFNYIWGIAKLKNCRLYQINGMEDHIHLLTDLHPTLSLSNYIKEIKVSSSMWLKREGSFPLFKGWQEGYGAFTCSEMAKESIVAYIKNQKDHHKIERFEDEYRRLLKEHEIVFEEKYLF